MYVPHAYRMEDRAELLAFMRANSFATLVSAVEGAPFASHVPVAVAEAGDELRVLGHLAKANPHAAALGGAEALLIFHGPHAYVSPAHYAARESVPTWNYIAVHAAGPARTFRLDDDPAATEAMLAAMVAAYEPGYAERWAGLPDRYRDGMLRGIVGFELRVARLEGKAKLSQNRPRDDRLRVATALAGSDDPAAAATGEAMLRGLHG